MVDKQYATRRDTLYREARGLIRTETVEFTAAGNSLDQYFSDAYLVEHYPHLINAMPGVRLRFRLDLARQGAIWDEGWTGYSQMNFRSSGITSKRQEAARQVVLAIILAADPEASTAASVEMCSFAAVPWEGHGHVDSDTWLDGRDLICWFERSWEHGDDPSPRVLDLLEEAIGVVRDGTNAASVTLSLTQDEQQRQMISTVIISDQQDSVDSLSEYRVPNRIPGKKRTEPERMRDESYIMIFLQAYPQSTRDRVAEVVGVSAGIVSSSRAWKRFQVIKKQARRESRPIRGCDLNALADPESAMIRSSDGGRAKLARSMTGSNARQ